MPGVYVSYPFCNQKCTFCNFSSGVSKPETIAAYENALLKQIHAFEWPWQPQTLYFGGGTPSLASLEFLHQLTNLIPSDAREEITLEAAPGTLTPERVNAWRDLGVNRISLGVQSFVTAELRQTGRRHTAQIVLDDITLLRAAGITNFNIDLIAGLPGQTRDSWRESLNWISKLEAPHVSVYIFEVDADSRLGNELMLGGVRYGAALVPPDDLIAELYETAVDHFAQIGVPRYEISNFARPGFESHHNLKYWRLEPYLGFGLDAHSYLDDLRFSTSDELDIYLRNPCARLNENRTDPNEEHFFVGLRLDSGITPTPEEWSRFSAPIQKWVDAGMLIVENRSLKLAKSAALLSNEIFADFLNISRETCLIP